ncbi:MAG: glycosyltransferase family 39 protein [Pirellulaceae bacterium]|nr:glycosyltransferase family 39 protein [Pirellulaceae bacterium]
MGAIFLVALIVRGGLLAVWPDPFANDIDQYGRIAETIRSDGFYGRPLGDRVRPTAFRPPLYPWILAAIYVDDAAERSLRIGALHAILGAIATAATFSFARRVCSRGPSIVAAGLVLIDPILLNQTPLLMTETLATALMALALWQLGSGQELCWWRATLAGILLALAALCRPVFLVALFAVFLIILCRRQSQRRWLAATALTLASTGVLAPWIARNWIVLHKPIVATTHGGFTLLLGNNPEFYEYLDTRAPGEVWDARQFNDRVFEEFRQLGFDEVAFDRWAYQQAIQYMRAQPTACLQATAVRVGRIWGLLPHATSNSESTARRIARYLVAVWYAAVFVLAGVGLIVSRAKLASAPWVWMLAVCLSFTLLHAFYWSNMRMRAPLAPAISVAAAIGLASVLRKRGE